MNNFTFSQFLRLKNTIGKRLVFVFAMVLVSFSSLFVNGQPTVTIGTGTLTTTTNPINSYYGYTYSQQIYLTSEISAGGAVAGQPITAIRFYWGGAGSLTNSGTWVVYLGNTSQATITSTSNWVPYASLTQVYNGAVALPGAAGWMTITLSTPYIWDGSNLVIAVDENVSNYASTAASWRYTSTSTNYRSMYYASDGTNPNPASPPTGTRSYNRPNIQLDFGAAPSCMPPTGLSTTNITSSSATLNWTASTSNPSGGYDIYYSTSSTAPTAGTSPSGSVAAGVTTYNMSSLSASTTYYVWVRSNCGGGDLSTWAGYTSFTTLCEAISSYPYLQSFGASLPNCWSVSEGTAGAGYHWAPTTADATYGAGAPQNGTHFMFLYVFLASSTYNPYYLTTGTFTLDAVPKFLSYYYYLGNQGYTTTPVPLTVQISTNGGSSWSNLYQHTTANSTFQSGSSGWVQNIIDLSAYTNTTAIFRFASNSNYGSGYCDQAIDEFSIYNAPSCFQPTALNTTNITTSSATVNWTASTSNPSGGYDIYYSTSTTAPTGGTSPSGSVAAGVTTYNMSSLSANTTYYVWVRANCGGGDFSPWAGYTSFTTACGAISSFPWTENFNSTTTPNLPSCWSQLDANGDGDYWKTFSTYGVSSTNCAGLYTDFNSGANNDYLILPQFQLTGNQQFKYFVRAMSSGEPNDYRVVLSTSGTQAADFTAELLPLTTVSSTTMTEITPINLSAYSGPVYIAIHVPSGGLDGYYIYFDNFTIEDIPACPALPTALASSAITSTTATISWTAASPAPGSGYEYYYSTSATAPNAGTTPSGSTAAGVVTANLSGLSANTIYYFWVRSNCNGTDKSGWAGSANFFTGYCTPSAISVDGTGITNVTFGLSPNIVNNTTGNESGTGYYGNYSAQIGDLQASVTSTVSITYNTDTYDYDTKIWIDLNDDLDFNDPGEEVYSGLSGSSSPNTLVATFTIPGSTSLGNHRMRIGGGDSSAPTPCTTGASYTCFEDYTINVTAAPACPYPAALTASGITGTQANLGWTENGSATIWDIELGISGFTPSGTPTQAGVTANPYTYTGLAVLTSYDFYVRSDCGGTNSSWAGPYSFTTAQTPATLTFTEGFETWPNDWSVVNGAQTNQWNVGTAVANSGNQSAYISNDAGTSNTYTLTSSSCVHLYRDISFSAGSNPFNLKFNWKGQGEGTTTYYDYLRVYLVPISTTPVAGTQLSSGQVGTTYNLQSTWQTVNIELPSATYAGQTWRLIFTWVNDESVGTQPPVAIDDIEVSVISCPAPSALTANNIQFSQANLGWTENGSSGTWDIELGVTGFTPTGIPTQNDVTTNPYTYTGLSGATTYQYYVRSDCGGSQSLWVGPYSFTTIKPEPTNQATNFAAGTVTTTAIPLTWTAAVAGTQLPDGYLIKASNLDYANIIDPIDGTDPANVTAFTAGLANKKITPGSASSTTSFTSMVAGTMYFYKIFSYTNSGTIIDFKTDNTPLLKHATKPNPATAGSFTPTSASTANITWTAPTGFDASRHNILVFVKAGAAATAGTPTSLTSSYIANTGFMLGTGYQNDANAYCVYNGDGTSVAITGLPDGTTFYTLIYCVMEESNSNGTASYSSSITPSGTTSCLAKTIPYFEGFEANHTNGSAISGCWTQASVSGSGVWTANSSLTTYNRTPFAGSFNAYLAYGNTRWMFQQVILTGGVNYTFDIYTRQDGSDPTDASITVSYGTTANAAGMTNSIVPQTNITNGNYQLISGNFTPASSGNYYLGIKGTINGDPWYISIDNISVYETPTCLAPTGVNSTAITTSSANVSWTASLSNPANGYQIYYSTSSTSPNASTVPSGSVGSGITTYSISGLTSGTNYYVWVRGDCNGDYSTWSGVHSFTTQLLAPVPYFEGFATTSTPTGYTNTDWTIGSVRGVTGNPGNNIYKNLWSSATTGQFSTINIGQIQPGMKLTFDYKVANYSSPFEPPAAGSGNFSVAISTDYGNSYTVLETVTNNATAGWQTKSYDLTPYVGQVIKIRIIGNWISGDWDLAFDNLKVDFPPYWTGNLSSDWNTAGNWSTGSVPTLSTDVLIPGTYTNPPIIDADKTSPAFCRNIMIVNGATLTINSNKALTVVGTTANNGTIKILSSAAGDASLLTLGGTSGTGVYKVERYLSPSMWHLVTSPITNALSGVFNDIWLRPYNEATNSFGNYITPSNLPLPVGQGYSVWTNTAQTRTFSGTVNDGALGPWNIQLSGGAAPTTGWNLIGNPYPSAIDWNAASGWGKTNIGGTIYLWNQSQYATYNGTVGTNGGSRYISSGQGFFVQASSQGASLTINNNVRLHDAVQFRDNEIIPDLIRINVAGNNYTDEAIVYKVEGSNVNYDYTYDAAKLYGASEAPQLYTKKQENLLAINAIPEVDDINGKYVFLEVGANTQYQISFNHSLDVQYDLVMKDLMTGSIIYPSTFYSFTATPDDSPARFMFLYDATGINSSQADIIHTWAYNNTIYVDVPNKEVLESVMIYNLLGEELLVSGNREISVSGFAEAVYLVKVKTNRQFVVNKVILK